MNEQNSFSNFPDNIRYSAKHRDLTYSRMRGYYALRPEPGTKASGHALIVLDDGTEVYKGDPSEAGVMGNAILAPIYRLQPSGALAVPTGLVFVRFKDQVPVESHREEIEQDGFEIAQTLDYAPNAAWLRPLSGDIGQALNSIAQLEQLPDVESVEPQMLTARSWRQ